MKNNHWMWMVLGCVLPLLFIFFAPALGIGSSSSLFFFIIFMFACHLFMPHGSHKHGEHNHVRQKQNNSQINKEESFTKTKVENKNLN